MKQSISTFWISLVKKESFGQPRKKIKSFIKVGKKITVVPDFPKQYWMLKDNRTIFFKFIYFEREQGRGSERKRERESQAGSVL